jgi:hypothetical protein
MESLMALQSVEVKEKGGGKRARDRSAVRPGKARATETGAKNKGRE